MAGVNPGHLAPFILDFVLQEGTQLREAPGVQAATGLPASLFGCATDIHQVLHHQGSTWGEGINNATAQHVVTVPPETVDLPGQFTQVASGRAGAFGLQLATEPEVAFVGLPPAARAEEFIIGSNSRAVQPQVNAYSLAVALKGKIGECDYHMQPEAGFSKNQVGAVEPGSLLKERSSVGVALEEDGLASGDGGKAGNPLIHQKSVSPGVVADRRSVAGGTGNLAAPFSESQGGSESLGSLHPSSADQLSGEPGKFRPERVVGGPVEVDPVLFTVPPAIGSYPADSSGALLKGVLEDRSLLRGRGQLQADGTLHGHILADFTDFRKERLSLSSAV
jgi:hypothetical protein